MARTCRRKVIASQPPTSEEVSAEAEEYPILRAVTRRRLVKEEETLRVLQYGESLND
jgi:hypothetical protein